MTDAAPPPTPPPPTTTTPPPPAPLVQGDEPPLRSPPCSPSSSSSSSSSSSDDEAHPGDSLLSFSSRDQDHMRLRDDANLQRLFESIGPPNGFLANSKERILLTDEVLLFQRPPTLAQLESTFAELVERDDVSAAGDQEEEDDGDASSSASSVTSELDAVDRDADAASNPTLRTGASPASRHDRKRKSISESFMDKVRRFRSKSNAPSPTSSHKKGSLVPMADMSKKTKKKKKHKDKPPIVLTLVLSNYALYTFPPPVEVDGFRFMVLNSYHMFPLQDILLMSLPYYTRINPATGSDYAARLEDFILHTKDGQQCWLRPNKALRSEVVETLSRAFDSLVGLHLDLENTDAASLIAMLQQGRMGSHIERRRMDWWATNKPLMQGMLWFSARGPYVADPEEDEALAADDEAPVQWIPRWVALFADHSLLHFASQQEFEAFRFVGSAPQPFGIIGMPKRQGSHDRFPSTYTCHRIDLSKCRMRGPDSERAAAFSFTLRMSKQEWENVASIRSLQEASAAANPDAARHAATPVFIQPDPQPRRRTMPPGSATSLTSSDSSHSLFEEPARTPQFAPAPSSPSSSSNSATSNGAKPKKHKRKHKKKRKRLPADLLAPDQVLSDFIEPEVLLDKPVVCQIKFRVPPRTVGAPSPPRPPGPPPKGSSKVDVTREATLAWIRALLESVRRL